MNPIAPGHARETTKLFANGFGELVKRLTGEEKRYLTYPLQPNPHV